MGARLPRIADAVDEREIAGVIDRGKELKRRMERGEAVAERQAVGVVEGGGGGAADREERFAAGREGLRGILGDEDVLPVGRGVGVVAERDDGVEAVVGAAEEDEEELLHAAIGPD